MAHEIDVEMPDGDMESFEAGSISELKDLVARALGVDDDEVAIQDEEGSTIRGSETPPQSVRVIPKQKWGSDVDLAQLAQDLVEAADAVGYDSQFSIKLMHKDQLNPFRVYLYDEQGEEYPLKVMLYTYPFVDGVLLKDQVTGTFEQRVPPCPQHGYSWHPNVFDSQSICWGNVTTLPGMTITGLLNTLNGLLHNPNHRGKVAGRCD